MKQRIITSVIVLSLLATMPAWGQTQIIQRQTKLNSKVQASPSTKITEFLVDGFSYFVKAPNKVYIRADKSNKPRENVVIPSDIMYKGMKFKVVGIGMNGFAGCNEITSLTIPSSVTEIEYGAFSGCTNLSSITFLGKVEEIGRDAFRGCKNLIHVTLPEGLQEIGKEAFMDCDKLESVKLPNSVTKFGKNVFGGHNSLASHVYNSRFFVRCAKKHGDTITIPEGIECICDWAFDGNGWTFNGGENNVREINLPSSLLKIDDNAFANLHSLQSIIIPEKVETIGDGAFYGSKISKVYIPESVKSIGKKAFVGGCVTSFSIPSSLLQNMGNGVVAGNDYLKSITVRYPDGSTKQIPVREEWRKY